MTITIRSDDLGRNENKSKSVSWKKYIREQFEDHDHLFERGLVNSLFAIQLVTYLEKAYQIEGWTMKTWKSTISNPSMPFAASLPVKRLASRSRSSRGMNKTVKCVIWDLDETVWERHSTRK